MIAASSTMMLRTGGRFVRRDRRVEVKGKDGPVYSAVVVKGHKRLSLWRFCLRSPANLAKTVGNVGNYPVWR